IRPACEYQTYFVRRLADVYKPAARRGQYNAPKNKNQGVGGNVGQDQKLSAVRQGAVYELAPARVFSRKAALLERGHTQGSQGTAAASSRGESESSRPRGSRVIRNRSRCSADPNR